MAHHYAFLTVFVEWELNFGEGNLIMKGWAPAMLINKFIEFLKNLGNHSQKTEKQNITVIDIDEINIEIHIDKQ